MAWHPFRNLGMKVLATVAAVLLWLIVSGERVERTVRAPLLFRNVPSAVELTGPPDSVDVHLRGNVGTLSRLAPGDVVAFMDLSNAQPGRHQFSLRTDWVTVPFDVDVTQVSPATVTLDLEPTGHAEVAVKAALEGHPAPGYDIGKVTVNPAIVEIIGPESRLQIVQGATTEVVSVEGATRDVQQAARVSISDGALRLKEPIVATVTVTIVAVPADRTFADRPVAFRNLAAGLQAVASPAHVVVTARGARSVVGAIKDVDMAPYVDLAGLAPGRYNLPVRVDSHGVYSVVSAPESVTVQIR